MNEGAEGLIYSDVPEEVFNGNPAAFLDSPDGVDGAGHLEAARR